MWIVKLRYYAALVILIGFRHSLSCLNVLQADIAPKLIVTDSAGEGNVTVKELMVSIVQKDHQTKNLF